MMTQHLGEIELEWVVFVLPANNSRELPQIPDTTTLVKSFMVHQQSDHMKQMDQNLYT